MQIFVKINISNCTGFTLSFPVENNAGRRRIGDLTLSVRRGDTFPVICIPFPGIVFDPRNRYRIERLSVISFLFKLYRFGHTCCSIDHRCRSDFEICLTHIGDVNGFMTSFNILQQSRHQNCSKNPHNHRGNQKFNKRKSIYFILNFTHNNLHAPLAASLHKGNTA